MELDTKTLSSAIIESCRESEKWLEKMVAQNAPSACLTIEELSVNDEEGDQYIFCEVELAMPRETRYFNFYAGDNDATLVERLSGEKGEVATGDSMGDSFEMHFDMPSLDDTGELVEFLAEMEERDMGALDDGNI